LPSRVLECPPPDLPLQIGERGIDPDLESEQRKLKLSEQPEDDATDEPGSHENLEVRHAMRRH